MPTLEQLGIDRLTAAEQIALAQEILDSVAAAQPRPALSEAKRQDLDRRAADAAANPADGVPWEQVEAAALARVPPMTTPVILRRLAQAEFDDAADWYDQRRGGRGAAFTAAVRQVLAAVTAAPDTFPEVHADIREAIVPGYPYAVYYRVDPGQVTVLAVYHTSRDPAGWQARA